MKAAQLRARWRCHESLRCCQYVDKSQCNSWDDPHLVARLRYRTRARVGRFIEWALRVTDPGGRDA